MKSLLRTRLVKSRFIALLTLGLSAVVVGATPPPVFASVSPAFVALHVLEPKEVQIDGAAFSFATTRSVKGKLLAYQSARIALETSVAAQDEAYEQYLKLSALSDAEVKALYPSGHYRATLAESVRYYNEKQVQAELALQAAEVALLEVTGGEALTDRDMADLHSVLGL